MLPLEMVVMYEIDQFVWHVLKEPLHFFKKKKFSFESKTENKNNVCAIFIFHLKVIWEGVFCLKLHMVRGRPFRASLGLLQLFKNMRTSDACFLKAA